MIDVSRMVTAAHTCAGVSPLSLALQHRRWATARVVLAIAVAQYKPVDAKPPKFRVRKVLIGKHSPFYWLHKL